MHAEVEPQTEDIFKDSVADWKDRLAHIVATMREMSRESDPQEVVRAYGERMRSVMSTDGYIAMSRRDLEYPKYRITRFSGWGKAINPWTEKDRLPVLEGGLLGDLIYGDEPRILDHVDLADDDPGRPYLEGMGTLLAIPHYDGGTAPNMAIFLRREPASFRPEQFPEIVWTSNLFGRAVHNLVLSGELKKAYDSVERELRVVADIQRSLLPAKLPAIPGLDLAAHYRPSRHAGGDYYDIFPLTDGSWGLLIADVSGHGTPAAVLMAITHSLAHAYPGPPTPPGPMLDFINDRLAGHYTAEGDTFVTAFYATYHPGTRVLRYASAGHNPPRVMRRGGELIVLEGVAGLPLGIVAGQDYAEASVQLVPGDHLLLYTDGITEAIDPDGRMYGTERLDAMLKKCSGRAAGIVDRVLADLDAFVAGTPAADDQTLLAARVS